LSEVSSFTRYKDRKKAQVYQFTVHGPSSHSTPSAVTDKETLTVNYRHGETVTNHLRLVQLLRRLEEENQPQRRQEACK